MSLQYITNTEGVPIAVQIPMLEWEKLMTELNELRRKMEVLQGIKEGIKEIKIIILGMIETKQLL
jgi:hypothetical protein